MTSQQSLPPTSWTISSRGEKRFRSGHPWVFANELTHSPKGLPPGAPIDLVNAHGDFLARGYGNPHSLIAFRALARVQAPIDRNWVVEKLLAALRLRVSLGLGPYSHRLCFGEADGLPGLVIDRFVLAPGATGKQALVAQVLTAGMEQLAQPLDELLEDFATAAHRLQLYEMPLAHTAVIVRRDTRLRTLEGLEVVAEAQVRREALLEEALIHVRSASPGDADPVLFTTDLAQGQKTGFFLDQGANVRLVTSLMRPGGHSPRILDLFCFVGQWATQLARHARILGQTPEVVLMDASESALRHAVSNVSREGARVTAEKADIVAARALGEAASFDVVVCDPPALIKSKKDHPQGMKAYERVNAVALKAVKPGGLFVSCSCSQHLSDEDFENVLVQAVRASGRAVRWVARGMQAGDHPVLMAFPQGRYLKSWIGVLEDEGNGAPR